MYVLYYTTRVLVTPTGLRPLPSLLIPATSFLLVATPVGYLLKLSRVSARTFHTFVSLARNAGRRSPLSMVRWLLVARSWIREGWSVVSWVTLVGPGTTRSRILQSTACLSPVTSSLKRVSLIVHHRVWGRIVCHSSTRYLQRLH